LQTWFGHYDPTEMYVDGVPGCYQKQNGIWVFEAVYSNMYGSFLERLIDFISILNKEYCQKTD